MFSTHHTDGNRIQEHSTITRQQHHISAFRHHRHTTSHGVVAVDRGEYGGESRRIEQNMSRNIPLRTPLEPFPALRSRITHRGFRGYLSPKAPQTLQYAPHEGHKRACFPTAPTPGEPALTGTGPAPKATRITKFAHHGMLPGRV